MIFQKFIQTCCALLLVVDLSFAKIENHKSDSKNAIFKNKSKAYKTLHNHDIPYGYVDGKTCNRVCDGTRRKCFFNFDLETFYSMNKACYNCPSVMSDCFRPDCIVAGGVRRTIMVVNRQLPGPPIEVCEGDMVMVFLQNNLLDAEAVTLHWHGQHMKGYQYMDGVPWVTQCPIHYNNNFTYEYLAANPGTFWWHSHVEMQRGDGVYGALIVRQTRAANRHFREYDEDLSSHVILVTDWNDQLRLEVFQAYALAGAWLEPTGLLVNGFGYQSTTNLTDTPPANFTVRRGRRYRFRLINAGFFDCPVEFSIDGHKMKIIAMDGKDVVPFDVDTFVSSSGERFDFVLTVNQAVSNYYIRVKGLMLCERRNTYTVATLRYEGAPNAPPTGTYPTYATAAPPPAGKVIFNPVSITNATGYRQVLGIHQPKAADRSCDDLDSTHVYTYYISADMSGVNNPAVHRYPYYSFNDVDPDFRVRTPQFNRISHKNLDVPLLPARDYINEEAFCDAYTTRYQNCKNSFCECPHVISVPHGAIIEFVFVELWDQDDSPALHPIHLHGHYFSVLAWGEIGRNITLDQVKLMDRRGQLQRNFVNSPQKDTVTVAKGGYTIVRFRADNFGYWLMHCHIDVHASEGMQLVVKVGENWQMPDEPEYFPVCGNWPRN